MHFPLNAYLSRAVIALVVSAVMQACSQQGSDGAGTDVKSETTASVTETAAVETADEAKDPNRVSREGVVVEFSTRPTSPDKDKVIAADWADVTFRITDANTGEPIKGRYPAAWMDLGMAWEAKGDKPMSCEDRVATYQPLPADHEPR